MAMLGRKGCERIEFQDDQFLTTPFDLLKYMKVMGGYDFPGS